MNQEQEATISELRGRVESLEATLALAASTHQETPHQQDLALGGGARSAQDDAVAVLERVQAAEREHRAEVERVKTEAWRARETSARNLEMLKCELQLALDEAWRDNEVCRLAFRGLGRELEAIKDEPSPVNEMAEAHRRHEHKHEDTLARLQELVQRFGSEVAKMARAEVEACHGQDTVQDTTACGLGRQQQQQQQDVERPERSEGLSAQHIPGLGEALEEDRPTLEEEDTETPPSTSDNTQATTHEGLRCGLMLSPSCSSSEGQAGRQSTSTLLSQARRAAVTDAETQTDTHMDDEMRPPAEAVRLRLRLEELQKLRDDAQRERDEMQQEMYDVMDRCGELKGQVEKLEWSRDGRLEQERERLRAQLVQSQQRTEAAEDRARDEASRRDEAERRELEARGERDQMEQEMYSVMDRCEELRNELRRGKQIVNE